MCCEISFPHKTKLTEIETNSHTKRNKRLFRVFLEWVFTSPCVVWPRQLNSFHDMANFKRGDSRTFKAGTAGCWETRGMFKVNSKSDPLLT